MINNKNIELFNQSSIRKDIDMVYDSDKHITNDDVVTGTFSLNESACSSKELLFGSLVASKLSVKLFNKVENLIGKKLSVSICINRDRENILNIGNYKVINDTPTSDRLYKLVVAYDELYDIIHKDVTEWYESLAFPLTQKAFRDSFFNYVGLEQVETTLINDDMVIEKTISSNAISGKYILSAICELNGAIGRMNREGKFAYIILNPNPTNRITINKIQGGSGSYEDYECKPISKVQIRQEANDIGAIVGTDGNTYIVQDNFLVYGKSSTDLTQIATNLLSVIQGITYRPFKVKAIYGNPCYEIGDALTVVTKNATFNTYMLNRTLSGINAMSDTIKAEGVEVYTENLNSTNTQFQQLKRQTNYLERTVEKTVSQITAIDNEITELGTRVDEAESTITQTADEIMSEVSKTYATQESVSNSVNNLQQQIDGAIETFTGSVEPTLTNYPANEWTTTAEKDTHIGDLYIVNADGGDKAGFYYRFEKVGTTYQWTLLKDNEVTKALQDAKEANEKAQEVANNLSTNYSTTTEMNSAIKQSADGITQTVSKTYTTKSEAVTSNKVYYALSSSNTVPPTSGWDVVTPEWAADKYMWQKTVTTYANGTTIESNPTCIQGAKGSDGTNGKDGTSYYTHIRYSANANGSNFVSSPTSATTYIGVYTGTSSTAPTSASSYTWSKYVGDKGATGNGINSITYYYATTTTQTAPSASSITSTSIPTLSATNKYLWQKEVIDYTDSSVADKTSVILLAVYGDTGSKGDTGKGVKSIVPQYYLSTSNTTQTGGSWSTTVPTWASGKYIWTRSFITWSDNTTSTTTPVLDNSLNDMGNRVTKAEASIKTNADNIELKVSKTEYTGEQIASLINQTAESIKILAEHIGLEGLVTINGKVRFTEDGSFEAESGKIGGWTIQDNLISSGVIGEPSNLTYTQLSPSEGIKQHAYFTEFTHGKKTSYDSFIVKQEDYDIGETGFGAKTSVIQFNKISTNDLNAYETININGGTGNINTIGNIVGSSIKTIYGADLDSLNNNYVSLDSATILLDGNFGNLTYDINLTPYKKIAIKCYIGGYINFIEVPTSILANTLEYYWLSSFYQISTSNSAVAFGISKTQIKLGFGFQNGSVISEVYAKVYGIK